MFFKTSIYISAFIFGFGFTKYNVPSVSESWVLWTSFIEMYELLWWTLFPNTKIIILYEASQSTANILQYMSSTCQSLEWSDCKYMEEGIVWFHQSNPENPFINSGINLTWGKSESDERRTFSGLRSQWTMFMLWRCFSATRICVTKNFVILSDRRPCSLDRIISNMSPGSKNLIHFCPFVPEWAMGSNLDLVCTKLLKTVYSYFVSKYWSLKLSLIQLFCDSYVLISY